MSMMIFIFLCFSGLFVMFFFILRSQEKMHESLREELAKTRAQLRLMEGHISTLLGEAGQPAPAPYAAPHQPQGPLNMGSLDSLSMGDEGQPQQANELELHFDPAEHLRR